MQLHREAMVCIASRSFVKFADERRLFSIAPVPTSNVGFAATSRVDEGIESFGCASILLESVFIAQTLVRLDQLETAGLAGRQITVMPAIGELDRTGAV